MYKHALERHGGKLGADRGISDFKMEALSQQREALDRILEEAVRIKAITSDPKINVLNSKMEYYGAQYVRSAFAKGPADQW